MAEDTVVVAQPTLLALLLELADRSDLAVLRGRPAIFRSGSRIEPNWSWSLPSPNTGGAFVLTVWDVSGSITIALAENIQELTNCLVLAVFPGDVSNVARELVDPTDVATTFVGFVENGCASVDIWRFVAAACWKG